MSTLDALRKLDAWRRGCPVERGHTLPWIMSQDEDALVVAFIRMAGENLPWGIAAGRPDDDPTIFTVPDPRKIDDTIDMLVEFAPQLLAHLPHPNYLPKEEDEPEEEQDPFLPLRQLWLPGGSHLSMLHFLDYRLSPARKAEKKVLDIINPLGRACGWLFREANRPGQFRVMDATASLQRVYDFPAEALRQQHLGFLLAWLGTQGGREERMSAARLAERQTIATTMDPNLEDESLRREVERYNQALANEDKAGQENAALAIREVLTGELKRRWLLTVEARRILIEGNREPNTELTKVIDLARREFTWQYYRFEAPDVVPNGGEERRFTPHPETDKNPSAAASRYFMHEHSEELTLGELVHGDEELVQLAIEHGDAFRGVITKVVDEGPGRKMIPVWTIAASAEGVMRLRKGSKVCVLGLKGRDGRIRKVAIEGGQRIFEVAIKGWKRARDNAPAANDEEALEGTAITMVKADPADLSANKARRVWRSEIPGGWLTHSTPAPLPDAQPRVRKDLLDLVEKLRGD